MTSQTNLTQIKNYFPKTPITKVIKRGTEKSDRLQKHNTTKQKKMNQPNKTKPNVLAYQHKGNVLDLCHDHNYDGGSQRLHYTWMLTGQGRP